MKQSVLDRSVARATGESVRRIRQMGFSLLVEPPQDTVQPLPRAAATDRSRSSPSPTPADRCA